MWLKKECCAFLLINVLLPKKVAKLISSKIFHYLEAQDNRSNKTKFCQSTKISYSCKIFMFLSIIYKLLFMHYFCIVGGPSMTQGNTPSLQRENHTHTHTLQLHCLWQYQLNHTFPKQLIQKIYWELHKIQSQIKNRKEDHY